MTLKAARVGRMESAMRKILLTANDPLGRELILALFDDARWAIVIDGTRQSDGWSCEDLAAAASAFRTLVFESPHSQSASRPTSS